MSKLRKGQQNVYLYQKQQKCFACGLLFVVRSENPERRYCFDEDCAKQEQERLLYLKNGIEKSWLKLRFMVFRRDNFTCRYCGRTVVANGIKLNIDHIDPLAMGGVFWDIDNLITACFECNNGKECVILTEKEKRTLSIERKKL